MRTSEPTSPVAARTRSCPSGLGFLCSPETATPAGAGKVPRGRVPPLRSAADTASEWWYTADSTFSTASTILAPFLTKTSSKEAQPQMLRRSRSCPPESWTRASYRRRQHQPCKGGRSYTSPAELTINSKHECRVQCRSIVLNPPLKILIAPLQIPKPLKGTLLKFQTPSTLRLTLGTV